MPRKNVVAEILNNLNSVQNMLKKRIPLNFLPTVFEEMLPEKRWKVLLFNEIVTIHVPF
jgi:hypothetical protein